MNAHANITAKTGDNLAQSKQNCANIVSQTNFEIPSCQY